MSEQQGPAFPCQAIPQEAPAARLLGIYPQRQPGLFMQRVKVFDGILAAAQLRGLAELATHYSPEYPLHLTTRQDVELHGLRENDVPLVQGVLYECGLTSVCACGDTLRNLTVCPENGRRRGTWDVSGLVSALREAGEGWPGIRTLPRKFKISVAGCPDACVRPYMNDLSFAVHDDGSLLVIGGGSLGARPNLGIVLVESLAPGEAVPLLRAALRLFDAEGDRQNRHRARLRHVRERLGDEEFRRRLHTLFDEERRVAPAGTLSLPRVEEEPPVRLRLVVPKGELSAADGLALATALAEAGAELRLGMEHDLWLFSRRPVALPAALAPYAHDAGGAVPVRVVACPGTTWCARGIADARGAAERLLEALPVACGLHVAVSGCPNNCAQSAIADIGLVGRVRQEGGERRECFRLLAGGGHGRTPQLAVELHAAIPAARAGTAGAWLAAEHAANAPGDGFAVFIQREQPRLAAALASRFGGAP